MRRFDSGCPEAPEAIEFDVEDAFSDHSITYWVPQGGRLVPASVHQIAAIEGDLRVERQARRFKRWEEAEARARIAGRRAAAFRVTLAPVRGIALALSWAFRRTAVFSARLEHGLHEGLYAPLRRETEHPAHKR